MNNYYFELIKTAHEIDQEARFYESNDPILKKMIVYSIDAAHSAKIRTWISEYRYPTVEMVGEEGMHLFWLLVQHQDLDLPLMEDCLERCEFNLEDTAFLTDRVRKVKGLPQVYGTQFHRVEGELVTYPIENEQAVDARRAEMGMGTLIDYVNSQK